MSVNNDPAPQLQAIILIISFTRTFQALYESLQSYPTRRCAFQKRISKRIRAPTLL